MNANVEWWKTAVIYQIYPRSFQDSNGDGIGDLAGIESRLDHLVSLGVDTIWLSPIYPSPMVDFGYDVTDYCDIDPIFGTMNDFDRLLQSAHGRGLRLLMDFVPSHTSDQHPWFVESRSSCHSAKRDWYIWADPAPGGGPPNNWLSEFGGPAWTHDEATGQYYLHMFLSAQPSLNWRNPEVRAALHDAMRFWMDRGVDGFRMDAVHCMVPDEHLRDNPPNPDWSLEEGPARSHLPIHTQHRPEIVEYVAEMRRIIHSYPTEKLLIGEIYGTLDDIIFYYGTDLTAFHLPFNFQLIGIDWQAHVIAEIVERYEQALPRGAWPNWVLGNHDRARIATRAGREQAGVAAMLLLTLRGTPTIYQGDELGMEDVAIPPDRVVDPWEKNVPGIGVGRDPVRTPIAWSDGRGAGFTGGDPWLPIDTRAEVRVDVQKADDRSILALYRRLLELRRREPALTLGRYRLIRMEENVFSYERQHDERALAIVLNFSDDQRPVGIEGTTLLSTRLDGSDGGTLHPHEGRILALD